ncbi:hypothetical protein [Sorangium sp. So ce1151]|uniref:hypothetical protein n=1 Tax=Sorangium sp. So ce1151 TaxID=3133332 RepID=UPI003F62D71F
MKPSRYSAAPARPPKRNSGRLPWRSIKPPTGIESSSMPVNCRPPTRPICQGEA